jgi:hypothetical protein
MTRRISRLGVVALLLGGWAGCKDEPNPCDSTTYLSGSDCLAKTDAAPPDLAAPDPDLAVATEAAAPAPDLAAPALDTGSASLLGLPCTDAVTHAECQGPDTDYCAIQPGTTVGYCTKTGCVTAADCPPNWTCFDLSMFTAGAPTMCRKP